MKRFFEASEKRCLRKSTICFADFLQTKECPEGRAFFVIV
jgi:hypothetical protein